MRRIIALCLLLAAPATADERQPFDWQQEFGEALRTLEDQLKPTLEDVIQGLGVLDQIYSFEHYEAPRVLENGDIIIRRSPEAPAYRAPDSAPPPGVET
ncbi:MAG: hypothetical protein AAF968_25610 [Pseudomonadota bacterium]